MFQYNTIRSRSQPYDHAVFKTESGSSLGQINIGKLFTKTALRRDTKTHESRPHIGISLYFHIRLSSVCLIINRMKSARCILYAVLMR